MLLANRTAIVYGASGAVGGAVAHAFAREGARVILAGRHRESLERVCDSIAKLEGHAEVLAVDASVPSEIEKHLASVVNSFGPVSLMFNAISWDDTVLQVRQMLLACGMPGNSMGGRRE